MTDRELMQRALDALEGYARNCRCEGGGAPCDAAKALRAALAQPEQEPVATLFGSLPVYDVPPKQEPVAWMHNFIDEVVIAHRPADINRHPDRWTALYKDPTPCQTCEALARTVMMDQTSHDNQPQREWIGLTDEDIEQIHYGIKCKGIGAYSTNDIYRAIEAKLREKNT